MREHLYRGKREGNSEWEEGLFLSTKHDWYAYIIPKELISQGDLTMRGRLQPKFPFYEVDPETISEYTGWWDKNSKRIFEGHIVRFYNIVGEIVLEKGAFGIGTHKTIDYNQLEEKVKDLNPDTLPSFCGNDNFISLWEIWCNFGGEDEQLDVVEIIGNKWDNPEFLEVNKP